MRAENQTRGVVLATEVEVAERFCARLRGLMGRPRLLLIDELSLGLAPLVVDHLLDLISRINEQGTAVLLVEQDVQVALEHAHRGYVLQTGRIVLEGDAHALLGDPRIRDAYLGGQAQAA